tara:strand:+ start:2007 stop:2186 length:180 start_codon:yes stop_codon:yes gene_type:complete
MANPIKKANKAVITQGEFDTYDEARNAPLDYGRGRAGVKESHYKSGKVKFTTLVEVTVD